MTSVFLGVEDRLSEAVGKKILHHTLGNGLSIRTMNGQGFGYLAMKIKSFAEISNRYPVLVLTDLDHKDCAPSLRSKWLKDVTVPKKMVFRVAVREIEAWLLADRDGIARFLGVSRARVPGNVEQISQPKEALLALARGARRELREDLLPRKGSQAVQGLGYNLRMGQFVGEHWNIDQARMGSDSLDRAIKRICSLRELFE